MNTKEVDRMNKAQYRDELTHKAHSYNRVKSTLELCQIMIQSLDPTTKMETEARDSLLSNLDFARKFALMAGCDVTLERSRVKS